MPRRPRPTSRRPPKLSSLGDTTKRSFAPGAPKSKTTRSQPSARGKRPAPSSSSSSDSESDENPSFFETVEQSDQDESAEEIDVDAPRVSQWVDEDEFDSQGENEPDEDSPSEHEADEFEEGSSSQVTMRALQNDLSSLPFGTLRKAQQTLAKVKSYEDSEESSQSEDDSGPEEEPVTSIRHKGKEREKQEIAHRKNKHAPMEVTSKRPVPRKKIDFEEKRVVPRDPRFLHIAGEFSAQKFQSQYGFLSDLHSDELKTLRENLKRAKKLLANSPRDLREEREQEVVRLERAMKRAESTVNRDKREKVEQTAMQKVAQEEREKRKQGKKAWYMKEADKRELLVRAKYEALAASGGRRAVKKAMDKKQKRVAQKEKKKRPFAPGHGRGEGGSTFAKNLGGDNGGSGSRPRKRQRVV
ncbi:hypothetical protein NLI96_g12615 [Meripilus lineatus]|uniref:rRNA biogenesis protein RRP36 n=1 Tax=Meripilus lineatus TaxID=2056292 RepID=A0AAD5URA9_9APHY|nr:hypothetical protein NLI96_g12615 [Physisporinus lineatus]